MWFEMTDIAIHAENLGKKYRATQRRRSMDLRETLTSTCCGVFAPRPAAGLAGNDRKPELWALKHVSFELRQGEVVALLGHNGAGKTTLLRILSRITEPTEGYAEIRGKISPLLDVGAGFHSQLTGTENVYVHGAILGMNKAEIRRKFDEIVSFAEVESFLDMPIKRWSRGMCVRLAFSVATHLETDVLLVDELLDGADSTFRQKCLERIVGGAVSEGRTVVFVSHDLTYARQLCTREMLFVGGQIVSDSGRAIPDTEAPSQLFIRI
jgi:lipopolysaccharide transport system ATP-binding protein